MMEADKLSIGRVYQSGKIVALDTPRTCSSMANGLKAEVTVDGR
jgi:hypothetical protein